MRINLMHPATMLLIFAAQIASVLVLNSPVTLALSLALALFWDIYLRKIQAIISFLKLSFPLVLFCTVFNALFAHYGITQLVRLPSGNWLTLESIVYGFIFGMRLIIVITWLHSFNSVMTPEKLIYLFGKFLPRLSLVLSMSLRFVPLLKEQYTQIKFASLSCGKHKSGFINSMRQAASNISILGTWALERGVCTSISMTARGYASGKRGRYKIHCFALLDYICIFQSSLCCIFLIVFEKYIKCSYNPIIKLSGYSWQIVALSVLIFAAAFLPVAADYFDGRRWKNEQSN